MVVALFRDRDGKYYANFWTATRIPVQNLDGRQGSFFQKFAALISAYMLEFYTDYQFSSTSYTGAAS